MQSSNKARVQLDTETELASYNEIIQIWENRKNYTHLTNKEVYEINDKMTAFIPSRGYVFTLCNNQTKQLPSNYTIDPNLIHSACYEHGRGNKTMVVFGNSHAIFTHAGIAYTFKDIYSEMTTIFKYSCVPLPEQQQHKRMSKVIEVSLMSNTSFQKERHECVALMNEVIKVLRGWHKQIDIIIILFGFGCDFRPGEYLLD